MKLIPPFPFSWYARHMLFLRKTVQIQKEIGETPLQALSRFVRTHPRYKGLPATYAGRLDPMASGKLLLLFGEECKNKESYLKQDKVYEVEVLLGVGSDTGDILGIVETDDSFPLSMDKTHIREALHKEVGSFKRHYPAFSSKTVNGKPLFMYALEGTLETIEIPTHTETVQSITLKGVSLISGAELEKRITSLLTLVPRNDTPSMALGADFRITAVTHSWEEVFKRKRNYSCIKIKVRCSSGTYMRTLAERIGGTLGTKALALSIHRTKIG